MREFLIPDLSNIPIPMLELQIEIWQKHLKNIRRANPDGAQQWLSLIEEAEEEIKAKRASLIARYGGCICFISAPCEFCTEGGNPG